MRTFPSCRWLLASCLLMALGLGPVRELGAAASPGQPPRPRLQDPKLSPQAARILEQMALRYDPDMTPEARDRDYLAKVALAKKQLSVNQLLELRQQSLALLGNRDEPSWETLRNLKWTNGDRVGVVISLPVWVTGQSRRVPAYAGFEKEWQTVALTQPRPSGYVWFASKLADINNKARYRAERTLVEINSRFAPLAALFLEYVFREGWFDVSKRVPILVLRIGEDTWAVSAFGGPVASECLNFPDKDSACLDSVVMLCHFESMADLHHGRHVPASNHRLGLAMDINDFNYKNVVDGNPNPVSCALRHYNREAMHKIDARNLPAWVYTAAKWLGLRIPQEWLYTGVNADWPHFDVGTRKKGELGGH